MANADRPNGFRPAKNLDGSPWNGLLRKVGVADGADIFIGDALELATGLAGTAETNDSIIGVAVGFGRNVPGSMTGDGDFDPSNLENRFYDDSAETHSEWSVWYVPADAVLFEVQSASDLDLVVGSAADLLDGGGSTTTGVSGMELTTSTNADVHVVELVVSPNNDLTLANARYLVRFSDTVFAQA